MMQVGVDGGEVNIVLAELLVQECFVVYLAWAISFGVLSCLHDTMQQRKELGVDKCKTMKRIGST